MPEQNASPETQPQPAPKQRCRYIKTAGEQCRTLAMIGYDYCWHHRWNRQPQYTGVKGYDRVPLLEDEASLQVFISQSMQGVMDGTLSESRARTLLHGANAATAVLRLRFQRECWLAQNKQQPEEPVREATHIDTNPLAPPQEYRGPTGEFEPYWSFSKYMYEQQCEQAGRPKPTCPADMPASGWMDQEEYFADPAEWTQQYKDKIKAAREQAEAAEKQAAAIESAATPREQEATAPEQEAAPATGPALDQPACQSNGCPPEEPERSEGNEEPCALPGVRSERQPDPDSPTIDLEATAAPPRSTLCAERTSTPCPPRVIEPTSYLAKVSKSNKYPIPPSKFFSGDPKRVKPRLRRARGKSWHS